MADNTEAKFILNFETSVVQIGTLGAGYVPPNPIAGLAVLQTNLTQILAAKETLDQKEAVEEDKRNAREDLFKTLAPRCSSVVNYCESMGIDENDLENLRYFLRELRGVRAKPVTPSEPGATPVKTISAAQTSFANQQDWFAQFVEKVRVVSGYHPPEDGLKLSDLEALRDDAQRANTDVITAESETAQARAALDELLYTGAGCVINAMKSAKKYILSVFGANHPVYQTITKFRFNLPKRLK